MQTRHGTPRTYIYFKYIVCSSSPAGLGCPRHDGRPSPAAAPHVGDRRTGTRTYALALSRTGPLVFARGPEDQTTTKLYRRDRSLGPGIEQPSAADRLSRQPVTSRQRQRACECMHLDDRERAGSWRGRVVWTDGGSPLVVQRKLLLLGGRTCRADLLGGGSALLAGPWLPRTTARERTLARHGSGR